MAADDPVAVEVPEEGVVTVQLDDPPQPAEPEKKPDAPEEKKPVPRVRIKEPPTDDPSKALQEALDNATRMRQAAEQTAQSERQRAENAERMRAAREAELQSANESVASREMQLIDSNIANATREIGAYQNELKVALEAGEFMKVAEVQTKLGKAAAALDRWEAKKADYESGTRQPVTEGRVEPPPQQAGSPFEQYVSGFAPAAQAWLRAHPECAPANIGGNPTMNAKMMKGHYDALSQGYSPNTDEYFRVIDETTGFRKVAAPSSEEAEELPPTPKPKPRVSAPPSREPPGAPPVPGQARTVRLSKEEQEAARLSFPTMTPQQAYATYAKNKVELEAEGKMGRTTH